MNFQHNEHDEQYDPHRVDEWLKHPPSSFMRFMTAALSDEVHSAEIAMRAALKSAGRNDPNTVLIDTFEDVLRCSKNMNRILQMGMAYQAALDEQQSSDGAATV